ncbi:MAG: SLC45 family MFS transporter [Chloroflexi bacterium]|nr:SLC45 family MFS transporter [Chloroflexota bacterium]
MNARRGFPWGRTFALAFGFFGISLVWPIFNNFVPLLLAERGVAPALIGVIMTWDNYFNIFVQPLAGALSDRTRTRWGRRLPWLMVGAPLAALAFVGIPLARTVAGMMLAIGAANFALSLFRAPTIALLGDLYPPEQRSTANGVINLMGGLGAILAFLVGGALYEAALNRWGLRAAQVAPFAFGALMLLLATGVVLWRIREPAAPASTGSDERADWRAVWDALRGRHRAWAPGFGRLLLALVAWFWAYSILEAWLSSFGKFELGLSEGRVSMLTAALPLAFVAMALPAGLAGSRWGRRRVIAAGLLFLVPLLALGLLVRTPTALVVLLAALGAAWALVNVNALPLVYDFGPPDQVGLMTGLYYIASNLALVLGPPAFGLLLGRWPNAYELMFPVAALGMALAAGLILSLPPARQEERQALEA